MRLMSDKCATTIVYNLYTKQKTRVGTEMVNNGHPIALRNRAQPLANYPHARVCNGLIYVSGISSRNFDGTWEGTDVANLSSNRWLILISGVKENGDGSWELDAKAQTRAVIEK